MVTTRSQTKNIFSDLKISSSDFVEEDCVIYLTPPSSPILQPTSTIINLLSSESTAVQKDKRGNHKRIAQRNLDSKEEFTPKKQCTSSVRETSIEDEGEHGKMPILSNLDYIKTIKLENGWFLQNVCGNKEEEHDASSKLSSCSSAEEFHVQHVKFSQKWKSQLRGKYNRLMKKVPFFPCINCSCPAGPGRLLSKIGVFPTDFNNPAVWYLQPYKRWFLRHPEKREPTLDALKHILRLCQTCRNHVVSSDINLWRKRNIILNKWLIPDSRDELLKLVIQERRLVSQVQPFGCVHISHGGIDAIRGPVTFVPLERARFTEDILEKTLNKKRVFLGCIYRHPEALSPYYSNYISGIRVESALNCLMHSHPHYINLRNEKYNADNINLEELNLIITKELLFQHLKNAEDIKTVENIYTALRGLGDIADNEDMLLIEVNHGENDYLTENYNSDTVSKWQAKSPMTVFMSSKLPVECLAFPYIFWKGEAGTYGNPDEKSNNMYFTDYVRIRTNSYDGITNLCRVYIFTLNFVKFKTCIFRDRNMFCYRIGSITAGEIRNENLRSRLDGHVAFALTEKIPGSKAYMVKQRNRAHAIVYKEGGFNFFITITINTSSSELEKYVEQVWEFRDAPKPADQSLVNYDVASSCNFIYQKFKAIKALLTSKKPNFWSPGKFQIIISSTEFQKRGWPHIHLLLKVDLPWNFEELHESHENIDAVLNFLDDHITTNQDETNFPDIQTHHCQRGKCLKGKQQICRSGFPRYPFSKSWLCFKIPDDEKMKERERAGLKKQLNKAMKDLETLNFSVTGWYEHHKINEENVKLMLRSKCSIPRYVPKRLPRDININQFEKNLHSDFIGANMDIQPVMCNRAAIDYVIKYQFKGEPTRKDEAFQQKRQPVISSPPSSDTATIRNLCDHFIQNECNTRKLTFVEAVWSNDQKPYVEMSVSPITVSLAGICSDKALVEECLHNDVLNNETNVHNFGHALLYIKRPNQLEHLSLADFVTTYEYSKSKNNALFVIQYFKQGRLRDIYFRRYKESKILGNFIRVPQINGSESDLDFTMFALFHPYRSFSEIQRWKDISLAQYELIHENFKVHRPYQPLDLTTKDYTDNDSVIDSVYEGDEDEDESDIINSTESLEFNLADSMNWKSEDKLEAINCVQNGIINLNCKQALVAALIAQSIDTSSLGQPKFRILVQGKAGTGKTWLIKIVSLLTRLLSTDSESSTIIRCSPTGVAAYGIRGNTIHYVFKFPPKSVSLNYLDELGDEARTKLKYDLKSCRLLIIDEISMVGINMWRTLDNTLRWATNEAQTPFGGVICLFTGDFSQIPPVGDESIAASKYINELRNFTIIELTEPMRQRTDPQFAKALQNFADGSCSIEDINLLMSLEDAEEDWGNLGNEIIGIYRDNDDVDAFNLSIINKLYDPSEISTYHAKYFTQGTHIKQGPLQFQKILRLAPGVPVMCLINLQVNSGLVNGAIGKVIQCRKDHIRCRFKNNVVNIYRSSINHSKGYISFTQFPLRCCWGITSHKVQGKTFIDKKVRVNGSRMTRNEIYVAISRTTNRSQLSFRNIKNEIFKIREPCKEMKIIRQLITDKSEQVLRMSDNRLLVFDSKLNWKQLPSEDILNGFHHYLIHRIHLLNPTCLIIIFPFNAGFIINLETMYGKFKVRNNMYSFGFDSIKFRRSYKPLINMATSKKIASKCSASKGNQTLLITFNASENLLEEGDGIFSKTELTNLYINERFIGDWHHYGNLFNSHCVITDLALDYQFFCFDF